MNNFRRLSVVACATTVGVALSATDASAGIIVDTALGTPFTPRDTTFSNAPTAEQTALVQGFTLTSPAVLETAALRGFSDGADITIAITSALGPAAMAGDIVFEQVFSLDADIMGSSIRTFDLVGLALNAGDYFFVIISDDPEGFEWAKVGRSGSVNINDRGASTFLSASDWFSQPYTFQENETAQVFTLQIDGVEIPAPGSVALLLGVWTGFAPRRRRC